MIFLPAAWVAVVSFMFLSPMAVLKGRNLGSCWGVGAAGSGHSNWVRNRCASD